MKMRESAVGKEEDLLNEKDVQVMDEKNEEQADKQKEDPVVANKWWYIFKIWFLGNFRAALDKM